MTHKWYALKVRSRFESLVATQLRGKGYDVFYPTYRVGRQWSDRTKTIDCALFPGYLFCSFDVEKRLQVVITPGVQTVVGIGRTPAPVEDSEIQSIRMLVDSDEPYKPHPYLSVGKRVRIKEGSLSGLAGLIVETKPNYRLVLSVDLLMRSVSVEVDERWIEEVPQTADLVTR